MKCKNKMKKLKPLVNAAAPKQVVEVSEDLLCALNTKGNFRFKSQFRYSAGLLVEQISSNTFSTGLKNSARCFVKISFFSANGNETS